MNTIAAIFASVVAFFGGMFGQTSLGATSVFATFQGGTGTSSPSGILYGDNGSTSHLNTVGIGSGLSFTGGTLSSTGGSGTVTNISTTYPILGGAITTTGTLSLAFGTTTSNTWDGIQTFTNNPILSALTGLISGNSGTLYATATSTLSASSPLTGSFTQVGSGGALGLGTIGIANGGTATTTGGVTNGVSYYNGTNITNGSGFTYNGNEVVTNASQPATTTSMSLDWANTPNQVEYRIGNAATTITIFDATTTQMLGSRKVAWVCNPNETAGALTWVGVEWIGTAPTQTTTANVCDVYSFDILHATSTTAFKVAGSGGSNFQ